MAKATQSTKTATAIPEPDGKQPFDPMELRSRMVKPLVAVVEGCPPEKSIELLTHLVLLIWEKVSFLDIEVRKGAPADGTVTGAAARFTK